MEIFVLFFGMACFLAVGFITGANYIINKIKDALIQNPDISGKEILKLL